MNKKQKNRKAKRCDSHEQHLKQNRKLLFAFSINNMIIFKIKR